jgi:hypothetical protein
MPNPRQSPRPRHFPRAVGQIVVMLATLVALAVPSRGSELAKVWQGQYFYAPGSNSAPVPFKLQITSFQDGNFTGRTTEPATFGTQPCTYLYANVQGHVAGAEIVFIKTYDGTCGQTHSVSYSGTMTSSRTMQGSWSIPPNSGGTFTASASDSN